MYNWRHMTIAQREEVLKLRKLDHRPWHSPPHCTNSQYSRFHISAACYEHKHFIGYSSARMLHFEQELIKTCTENATLFSWCVLSNHWHILIKTPNITVLLNALGQLHGRISHEWNEIESLTGRKVWCNSLDRPIKGDKHFWATNNYIHHNPVHHGYSKKWQEWPFSSAKLFLDKFGERKVRDMWSRYDISSMGLGWDPPEL